MNVETKKEKKVTKKRKKVIVIIVSTFFRTRQSYKPSTLNLKPETLNLPSLLIFATIINTRNATEHRNF